MRCFGNPIIMSGFIIYNILFSIVKKFSVIHGCRHNWLNHVKSSCSFVFIVLSFYSLYNIIGIKASNGTTYPVNMEPKTIAFIIIGPLKELHFFSNTFTNF